MNTKGEIASKIRQLRERRYKFFRPPWGALQNLPTHDHWYDILLTLALNAGHRYSFAELAGHMPYSTNEHSIRTQWQHEHDTHAVYRGIILRDERLSLDPNATITKTIQHAIADAEQLPADYLYPQQDLTKSNLYYWDSIRERVISLEPEPGNYAFRLDDHAQIEFFARPFNLEYVLQRPAPRPSSSSLPRNPSRLEDDAHTEELLLSRKYSNSAKRLRIQDSFSRNIVEDEIVHHSVLATRMDMLRFLYSGISDRHAPTLEEWDELLDCNGLATLSILEILRRRHSKPHTRGRTC